MIDSELASPERNFLLACLRYELDPERFSLPAAPAEFDWNEFRSLVFRNRVDKLCYRMGKQAPQLWPAAFQKSLYKQRIQNFFVHRSEPEQVCQALQAFRQAGVKCVVLKGWALIQSLYAGDFSLRPSGDIDILVTPAQRLVAESVLISLGFSPYFELWPGYRQRYPVKEWHFIRHSSTPDNLQELQVDLHWGFYSIPYIDEHIPIEDILARSVPLKVGDEPAFELSIEDAILFNCGHIALHHRYLGAFKLYFELAWLIQSHKAEIDWQELCRRAAAWKLALPLKRILGEVEDLFQISPPQEIGTALRNIEPGKDEQHKYMFLLKYTSTPLTAALPANWSLRAGWLGLRLLLEWCIPGPTYLRQRMGPARFWGTLYWRWFSHALKESASVVTKGLKTRS